MRRVEIERTVCSRLVRILFVRLHDNSKAVTPSVYTARRNSDLVPSSLVVLPAKSSFVNVRKDRAFSHSRTPRDLGGFEVLLDCRKGKDDIDQLGARFTSERPTNLLSILSRQIHPAENEFSSRPRRWIGNHRNVFFATGCPLDQIGVRFAASSMCFLYLPRRSRINFFIVWTPQKGFEGLISPSSINLFVCFSADQPNCETACRIATARRYVDPSSKQSDAWIKKRGRKSSSTPGCNIANRKTLGAMLSGKSDVSHWKSASTPRLGSCPVCQTLTRAVEAIRRVSLRSLVKKFWRFWSPIKCI
jgi:hypothetical protein